jgi:predicted nucleic acid-binding protein
MIRSAEWLFVDTSAFIALCDAGDQYHEAAKSFFTPKHIRGLRVQMLTTNWVFSEVYAYFCRVHEDAMAIGAAIRESKALRYVRPEPTDEEAAWQLAQKYGDKDFSFVDCLSLAIMLRIGCTKAFTFDSHSRQMGFEMLPDVTRHQR